MLETEDRDSSDSRFSSGRNRLLYVLFLNRPSKEKERFAVLNGSAQD